MRSEHSPSPEIEQASSEPALRWLEEHGDVLYQFAIRRVRRADIAEDLVQETLLAALSAQARFGNQSAERTWLVGILKHKVIDYLRQSFRQQERRDAQIDASTDFFDRRGRWKIKFGAWPSDPTQTLENAEFRQTLDSCLAKLPARIAQLFWLREAEGLDSEWLCLELRISPTNMWTMLSRARLGLRKCLSVNWFDTEKK
jgi:RNA polymerase sigma-70 factor (ECF subfamily)